MLKDLYVVPYQLSVNHLIMIRHFILLLIRFYHKLCFNTKVLQVHANLFVCWSTDAGSYVPFVNYLFVISNIPHQFLTVKPTYNSRTAALIINNNRWILNHCTRWQTIYFRVEGSKLRRCISVSPSEIYIYIYMEFFL